MDTTNKSWGLVYESSSYINPKSWVRRAIDHLCVAIVALGIILTIVWAGLLGGLVTATAARVP
jgi:hypothetical protein